MKILAIDYGEKRIGLAISDELGIIASPMPVLKVFSLADAIQKIHRIIKTQGVEKVVIGLALGPKREETQQSIQTRYFAESLKNTNGIEIDFWNESFSTNEAIKSEGINTTRKRKNLDSEAARIILQEYLDSKREMSNKTFFIPQEKILY